MSGDTNRTANGPSGTEAASGTGTASGVVAVRGAETTSGAETTPGMEAAPGPAAAPGTETAPEAKTSPGTESASGAKAVPGVETAPGVGVAETAPGPEAASRAEGMSGVETAPGTESASGAEGTSGTETASRAKAAGVAEAASAETASGAEVVPGTESASGAKAVPGAKAAPGTEAMPGPEAAGGAEVMFGAKTAPGAKRAPGTEAVPGAEVASGTETTSKADVLPGTRTVPGAKAVPGAKTAPGTDSMPGTEAAPGLEVAGVAEIASGTETASRAEAVPEAVATPATQATHGTQTASAAAAPPSAPAAPAPPTPGGEQPGRLMAAEMAEQPDVLRRILVEGAPRIRAVAEQIAARRPRFVLLTARGTSDNAALYAKYLFEVRLGKPCGLTSMSTTTAYGARPDLRDCLVVTVSQSGGSPDLVASTRAAREAGAITLAVTNNAGSALAGISEFHIDVLAGPERALPATKTYTAELLALYLLVEGLRVPGDLVAGDLAARALPDLAESVLARHDEVRALAARYRFAERMVLTSRGYGYPTAKEAALKLMETSYIPALSYSGADLLHGPLAMVDNISPVIAIVTDGKGGQALWPVLERLRDRGADLVVIGGHAEVGRAAAGFALPTDGVAEELQPILEILPLQRLAYEVTLARGQDPDAPRSLAKITETR